MSQSPKPRGLGRGLSALLGDEEVAATVAPPLAPAPSPEAPRAAAPPSRTPFTLPIAHLRAGTFQPRTVFEDKDGLVDSVRQFGLLQPILVRPVMGEPEAYEIIAGERRWRAAQKAQLHEVPVVVRTLDDLDALQLALVENLQRTDLSADRRGHRLSPSDGAVQPDPGAGGRDDGAQPPACRQYAAPARPAGRSARSRAHRRAERRPGPHAACLSPIPP